MTQMSDFRGDLDGGKSMKISVQHEGPLKIAIKKTPVTILACFLVKIKNRVCRAGRTLLEN